MQGEIQMTDEKPYIITISRELGSGGAYLGQRLASRLGIAYADREIVRRAAESFDLPEDVVEPLDEKVTPFWLSLLRTFEYGSPEYCCIRKLPLVPSDTEFHDEECRIVEDIAQKRSAVIVGRGGFFLLRDNPRHLSVFLFADKEFRVKRIKDAYDLSVEKAEELIEVSDRDRRKCRRELTRSEGVDARLFHLCLDTGALGLECAEEIIVMGLLARIGASPAEQSKS
jgi:cytidylate kinase